MTFKKKITIASGDKCKECRFIGLVSNRHHWCNLWGALLVEDGEYGTFKCSKCIRKIQRTILKAQETIDDTY